MRLNRFVEKPAERHRSRGLATVGSSVYSGDRFVAGYCLSPCLPPNLCSLTSNPSLHREIPYGVDYAIEHVEVLV